MNRATYKVAADGTYFGEISGFKGLWANEPELSDSRQALQETLHVWLLAAFAKNAEVPTFDGIAGPAFL